MVSEADMAGARELCPTARLRYVPNVVDVAAIAPVSPLTAEPRAIFVASFHYEPNRNAPALPAGGGLPARVGDSCPRRASRSWAPASSRPPPAMRASKRSASSRISPPPTPARAAPWCRCCRAAARR